MRIVLTFVALTVLGTSDALAQPRARTLDELRRELAAGDVISVERATAEPLTGRLVRLGDTELEIRTERRDGGQRRRVDLRVAIETIQSLERRRDSTRNGTLIGAGIGAGAGLALFTAAAVVDYNEIDEWAPIYLTMTGVFAGAGALLGWGIDASMSKPHVRYTRGTAARVTVRVRPLTAQRRGVALVVSF